MGESDSTEDKSLARWKELIGDETDGAVSSEDDTLNEDDEDSRLPRVGEPQAPPQEFSPIVLEELDKCLFRGPKGSLWRPRGQRGVFGGQVLGQSVSAAIATVTPDKDLHSIHSYFLRAGKETRDIIYHINELRDGASFSTRMVTAMQGGTAIFVLIASFQRSTPAMEWSKPMPIVPAPDQLPTEKEFYMALMEDPRCNDMYRKVLKQRALQKSVMDVRRVVTHDYFADQPFPADYEPPIFVEYTQERHQILWMRTNRRLSDDANVHRAVLAYASDIGLLSTAKGTTPLHSISQVASLDHSMWFHADFRADEWLLYVMASPRGSSERGLTFGRIYRRDGTLAVSVSQEGVLRLHKAQL